MRISQRISPQIIAAATGMLQPSVPELSPQTLIAALKAYDTGKSNASTVERPITRKEAAELLQCSLNTVSRFLSSGKLRRIRLTERSVRIAPESIRELLSSNAATMEG